MSKLERESVRKTLSESLEEAEWSWVAPHAARGAVVVVSPELTLVEVGVEIAVDSKAQVKEWLDQKLLGRPTDEELRFWNENPSMRFQFLVLQPYVLIQKKAQ